MTKENYRDRLARILDGDFIEFTAYFANGTTASLSEYDGVETREEATKRATKISIMEGRGSVIKLLQTAHRKT